MKKGNLTRMLAWLLVMALLMPLAAIAEEIGIENVSEEFEAAEIIDPALLAPEIIVSEADPVESADSEGDAVSNASSNASANEIELSVKQTYTLKAPAKNVTWQTSKKSVATVSSKGVVTAKKKGTAKITCLSSIQQEEDAGHLDGEGGQRAEQGLPGHEELYHRRG